MSLNTCWTCLTILRGTFWVTNPTKSCWWQWLRKCKGKYWLRLCASDPNCVVYSSKVTWRKMQRVSRRAWRRLHHDLSNHVSLINDPIASYHSSNCHESREQKSSELFWRQEISTRGGIEVFGLWTLFSAKLSCTLLVSHPYVSQGFDGEYSQPNCFRFWQKVAIASNLKANKVHLRRIWMSWATMTNVTAILVHL